MPFGVLLTGCTDAPPPTSDPQTDSAGTRSEPLVEVVDDERIEVGRKLLRAGRVQEADVLFETVVRQRPELARANFYRGLVLQKRKFHAGALDRYQAAADSNQAFPERATLPYFMAWSAYHAGEPDRARIEIDRFLADPDVVPRADASFLSGLIHFDADRLSEAEADFRRAIERSQASGDSAEMRDMTRAWVRHADVLSRLDRDREALVSIDRALELDPDLTESWFRKYTILTRIGDEQEAASARTRWEELRDQGVPSGSTGDLP
ncbi:MAG: tetratricopeptide repeat protein [Planctomycetota bacterium]|nr:tetratricopeptide repeat protein [Planctomycetota bacterium]